MKNKMISNHFKRSEFSCKDGCGGDVVDAELITVLEGAREYFGKPVRITSGYRCAVHNRAVGGKAASQHLLGKAADITVDGESPGDVCVYFVKKYPDQYGIGLYKAFVHIDVRSQEARW